MQCTASTSSLAEHSTLVIYGIEKSVVYNCFMVYMYGVSCVTRCLCARTTLVDLDRRGHGTCVELDNLFLCLLEGNLFLWLVGAATEGLVGM